MRIKIACPDCGRLLVARQEQAGRKGRCPNCGQRLVIPEPRPEEAADELVGTEIAHYRIESVLGQGGMAKVYKATNLRLTKVCALKILAPRLMGKDSAVIERFLREARMAARLEHPNVLPVWFVGEDKGRYFIEMQYAPGGTLSDLLEERGRLSPDEAVEMVKQVAVGLDAAHAVGIVHRDMKPSNVLFTRHGMANVADFGLARMSSEDTSLTLDGQMVGTPLYMSPEQAEGKPSDHRSDIYSLGVVFFHMLTGSPPFSANTPAALAHQHVYSPMPPLGKGLPSTLEHIIQKMTSKKPEDRFQSCKEIISALNSLPPLPAQAEPAPPAAKAPEPEERAPLLTWAGALGGDDEAESGSEAEVDLTPMIDVTFLLLIFFMVTATYITQQTIELPKTGTTSESVPGSRPPSIEEIRKYEIVIDITEDGRVYVDEEEISISALVAEIARRVAAKGKSSIVINPDAASRHEVVVRVIDAAKLAGVEQINVAVVKKQLSP